MKRTLITGTNGFLASRLIDFAGQEVFGISRSDNHKAEKKCTTFYGDILDLNFLKRIISEIQPDIIYHLAAQSIVRIANSNPDYCFRDNIMGVVNILEAIRQINPNIKVLVASSDKSYGDQTSLPYFEHSPLQAGDPYSTSKACGDLVAQSYYKTYGLNINIIRSANIYGNDMNLSRIIPNTITRILKKEKPMVYSGVMGFKREFIYVDDVCEGYKLLSEKGKPGEAYNIGSGEVYKVGDMITMICEIMNWKEGVDVVEKSFPEIETQYLSCGKIKGLGWQSKTTLKEGLEKTINWYENKFR